MEKRPRPSTPMASAINDTATPSRAGRERGGARYDWDGEGAVMLLSRISSDNEPQIVSCSPQEHRKRALVNPLYLFEAVRAVSCFCREGLLACLPFWCAATMVKATIRIRSGRR
jgi:hypothetical protein